MKKILALPISIVVLVTLALPPVAGKVTRDQLAAASVEVSDSGVLTLAVSDVQAGWRTSKAQLEFRLTEQYLTVLTEMSNDPDSELSTAEADELRELISRPLIFSVEMEHGPILPGNETALGWASAVVRLDPTTPGLSELLEELDIDQLIEIRAQTGLTGTTIFSADMPAFDYINEIGNFRFSGLQISGTADKRDVVSSGIINSFAVYGPAADIELAGIKFAGDQQVYEKFLWLGEGELLIDRIDISPANEPPFSVQGFRVASNSRLSETPGKFAIGLDYAVTEISAPGFRMADVQLGAQLLEVDISSWKSYYELNRDMAFTDPEVMNERAGDIQKLGYEFASGSPSMLIEPFRFDLNDDNFDARLRIDVDGSKLPPEAQWDPTDTMLLTQMLGLDLDASIDTNLALQIATQTVEQQLLAQSTPENPLEPEQIEAIAAEQAPALLDTLVLQGMLTRTEQGYAADITFREGQLSVNGQAVPLGLGPETGPEQTL